MSNFTIYLDFFANAIHRNYYHHRPKSVTLEV